MKIWGGTEAEMGIGKKYYNNFIDGMGLYHNTQGSTINTIITGVNMGNFSGISKAASAFLKENHERNDKSWFHENKDAYQNEIIQLQAFRERI